MVMISHDRALEALVRRLHGGILLVAIAAVAMLAPLIGVRAWPTVAMFALIAVLTHTKTPMWALLGADLLLALGLWWLFGPVSGASFIPYVVVSLGPLVLTPIRARVLLVASVATVAAEAALHFASDFVALPLFHPPDPIPDGTFLAGIAIQLILLIGVGALMVRIAEALRAGREALAADLERQRELHRLKDSFLATASHQLRTPLTALRGFSRLLLDTDVPAKDRAEYIGLVVEQTEEMHTLIEDLITFNRIEAGEFSVKLEPVRLAALIDSTVEGMGPQARHVSIEIDPEIEALADPLRLSQVIRNLVDNAIKYGAPPVTVMGVSEDGWFRCTVADGGPGLDPMSADAAFEPYTRFVSNETMSEAGLGLGLAVVRELISRQGGTVRYRGPAGGFEVRIPLAEKHDAPSGAQLSNSVVSG
jgi:signal transduction histidine kinase